MLTKCSCTANLKMAVENMSSSGFLKSLAVIEVSERESVRQT